ncbi:Retron-type reverse transcriptase [Vreelandella subterranea]|uniref:Retron-type reverse transcriptase n=1 Tax=Vreelandella subterranea TaxID=416874 RepID=A0A1H9UTX2_9GAMM|nr:RNA-directed DNA polymerase [Halomonas subterranea]SES12798.1 Retron-type reverse transcriptase [Halomonas subterranea]
MAKRYRNLIERIADPENLRNAYHRAARGRRNSAGYLNFKEYEAAWLAKLRRDILDQTYKPGKPREFWVFEPKPRPITAAPFQDRVVQHALCAVIGPIFEAGMLPQAYACRKGRGMHSGAIHTQAMMRKLKRKGEAVYALKTDFSKYFYSVDLAVLWRRIDAKISCRHTAWLIEQFTPRTGIGLPIGNLTSQLWANVYGTEVDRFLAQTMGESRFVRYMDDIVIMGHSRSYLHALRGWLEMFCRHALGLTFSKWSVGPVSAGVNFLGYRIFPTHKLLRRDSVRRAKRKIKAHTLAGDHEALRFFLAAWLGHAKWADSHNLVKSLARQHHALAQEAPCSAKTKLQAAPSV